MDRCEPFIEGLNRFSGRFKGFYRLEIVPEMYDEEKVALVFDRRFLNFLKALNELDDIDVDQYVFW